MSTEPFFVPPSQMADQHLAGIRGWLILPLLGLIVTIAFFAYSVIQGFIAGINSPEVASDASVAENYADRARLIAMIMLYSQIILTLLVIGLAVYCLTLFLKKKEKTPFWMIVLYFCGLGLVLLNAANMNYYPDLYEEFMQSPASKMVAFRSVTREIVNVGIWVSYFRKSRRVAATFVN